MPHDTAAAESRTQGANANVVAMLSLGLRALSARLVLVLALLMCFALFAWAMIGGRSWISVATAVAFALLVFLPVLWRGHHAPNV